MNNFNLDIFRQQHCGIISRPLFCCFSAHYGKKIWRMVIDVKKIYIRNNKIRTVAMLAWIYHTPSVKGTWGKRTVCLARFIFRHNYTLNSDKQRQHHYLQEIIIFYRNDSIQSFHSHWYASSSKRSPSSATPRMSVMWKLWYTLYIIYAIKQYCLCNTGDQPMILPASEVLEYYCH